ncbi:fibrillarin-like rRNA/tRNA 2'-O-methyltransferase [Candidatus Micrarchaeota archaeon]|nr:fibrillarin-like rRNA/tRNA 2'-O-methyltransferase [Candidatus Micrarchaeota archaeon]
MKHRDKNKKKKENELGAPKKIFDNVYLLGGRIVTPSLVKGYKVYNEKIFSYDKVDYRSWTPYRSKLSAAIKNNLKQLPIKRGSSVLYLGASTGTTSSHVSDIIGPKGVVYCIEFSAQMMAKLIPVCKIRKNMIPIMADARKPESYSKYINGKVDVIYEDVAQPDQAEILIKNADVYLKKRGYAMIAIKSQSIDVTEKPEKVYDKVENILSNKFKIIQRIRLEPYEKDHLFLLLRLKH